MYSVNSSSACDLHVNIPDAVCIMERLRARISFMKGCIYRQKYIINFSKQAVDAVYHTQQHHWVARIAPCYVCEFMLPSNVYGLLYRVTQIFHCIQILLLLHWCGNIDHHHHTRHCSRRIAQQLLVCMEPRYNNLVPSAVVTSSMRTLNESTCVQSKRSVPP